MERKRHALQLQEQTFKDREYIEEKTAKKATSSKKSKSPKYAFYILNKELR